LAQLFLTQLLAIFQDPRLPVQVREWLFAFVSVFVVAVLFVVVFVLVPSGVVRA
jgi:hypothetical protein